jgi:hypothetical protein
MKTLSICLFSLIIFQFSGCATTAPTASVAPITTVEALPAHKTQAELTVGADPYYSRRQKSTFGQDMSQAGILPILVYLQNNSAQPITVQPNYISLEFLDGQEVKPIAPLTASEKWGLKAGRYVAAGAFYGVTGVIATKAAHEKAKANIREEYQKKGLREVTLSKGESAQGFVYFYVPQGIQQATGANLIVPYLPAKGRGGEVRVPLGGM